MITFELDKTEEDGTRLEVVTELTGVGFTIELRWFDRLQGWYLYLFDAADAPLVVAQRMAVNTYALLDLVDERLPVGKLALVDETESGTECDFENLGQDCQLVYSEPDEVVDPRTVNIAIVPYTIQAVAP
jgi:hypothetical protein